MCTAITYQSKEHYFGRNLDFQYSFGEKVVITARKFPFSFRKMPSVPEHYAMIGMGIVSNNFPLYFDATNEAGLSMAGLLFPELAYYHPFKQGYNNVASFELIPWVLSQCQSLSRAKELLKNTNVTDIDFSSEYPSTPLHWIVSDKTGSITVESVKEGLFIYDNPAGVLTNSPDFQTHMAALDSYAVCSSAQEKDLTAEGGLPGDASSVSRFVRAAFTRCNSVSEESEQSSVSQFFHILGSVYRPRGCTRIEENPLAKTHYSSCTNTGKGIYYYTTHDNACLNAVAMNTQNLDCERVYTFPLIKEWRVNFQS